MIVEYYRPDTIEDALNLLSSEEQQTIPMGGGTKIKRLYPEPVAVVDLQKLGLESINQRGNFLEIGATATLEELLTHNTTSGDSESDLAKTLIKVIRHEATSNLRQIATIAGTLISADGRSPFTTLLHALDAKLTVIQKEMDEEIIGLGDLLPFRSERIRGCVITKVTIQLNTRLAYEYVARTPADLPIVCVGLCIWPSGRTRVALGGFGDAPIMAFDGTETNGANAAARSAFSDAGDEWASSEYRQEIVPILVDRCVQQVSRLNQ